MKRNRGVLITLEGMDGTGKSTQCRALVRHLRRQGHPVVSTREPGGTEIGEQIRRVLLTEPPGHGGRRRSGGGVSKLGAPVPLAELMLMYAARAEHLEEVVRPALERGEIVVSDRFNDASVAYQGYGRRLGARLVKDLDRIVCGRTQPDLTLIFDLDPRVALGRARGREVRRRSARGRFEAEGLEFQERVRRGYHAIARAEPRRVRVIQADRPATEVAREVRNLVDAFLVGHHGSSVPS